MQRGLGLVASVACQSGVATASYIAHAYIPFDVTSAPGLLARLLVLPLLEHRCCQRHVFAEEEEEEDYEGLG